MEKLLFTLILVLTVGIIYLITGRNRRQINKIPEGMAILCQPPGKRYVVYALGVLAVVFVGIFSILYIMDGAPGEARGMWSLCVAMAILLLIVTIFAGNIIDMDIGLSMAQEFDPMTNSQVTITGNLYQYLLLLMMVVTNMHHYVLRALIDSYQVIPVNGQVFQWDSLAESMTTYMADSFVIAFRIVLPVFACMMILNCILGIMAKVAPQMNMFAVGMQMKVLLGLTVLFLTVMLLPGISDFVFKEMKRMIVSMIEGMY
jgi:flagellar biosynthetic protein FliR